MFKYNTSSMQPLAEESEPASDVSHSRPDKPEHELSGQDAALIARIKKMREVIESLRLRLSVEKDNLARERLEAASVFPFQSTPATFENFALRSLHSLPTNHNVSNSAKLPMIPTASDQYYEPFFGTYYDISQRDNDRSNSVNSNYLIDPAISDAYRGHLQDVEKMCLEEFNKMQASISSLRKLRAQSREYSTDEESLNSVTYDDDSRRLHRRYHRSGSSKHRKGHHRGHHCRDQSKYILPDDVTTVEKHRRQYYCQYSDRSPKKIYHSPDTIKGAVEEYSGDSTEAGVALWHLDSPYDESDYK